MKRGKGKLFERLESGEQENLHQANQSSAITKGVVVA